MAYLTSRIPAPSVACNDILHIVKTTDTSQNPAGSSFKATVSQLFQCCVNDFYVKNIHGCNTGDLFVQPLDEGDVFFGENTAEDGFTIKLDVGVAGRTRLGLHQNNPGWTIDAYSYDDRQRLFWYDNLGSIAGDAYDNVEYFAISGAGELTSAVVVYGPGGANETVQGAGGIGMGFIGFDFITNDTIDGFGAPGDAFIAAAGCTENLNIINDRRNAACDSSSDNIRFYAHYGAEGTDATPNTPHLHIHGRANAVSEQGEICVYCIDPTERLDVNGTIKSRANLNVALSGSIGTNLYVNDDLTVGADADISGDLIVDGDETLNGNLFMTPNRKIGIGTTSPTEQLDCSESARFRNVGVAGGTNKALYVTSNGTLTTNSSDVRLKENISTIENALEKVTSMRGVNFSWKEDESSTMTLGFIAQELEQVEPKLVYTNENTEEKIKGVRYDIIGALLVEAVKELNEKTKLKEYTPTSISDPYGEKGDQVFDDNFMYIKTGAGWKKFPLMDM